MAFGFAVAFGVYASAGVSGGHINPAVTMAMFTLGKLGTLFKIREYKSLFKGTSFAENLKMFFVYSISQLLGAFTSCFVVYAAYCNLEAHLVETQNFTGNSFLVKKG